MNSMIGSTLEMTPRTWLCLVRSIPAIVAMVASGWGHPLVAGSCLVIAVWADACAGWCARRAGWGQTPAGIQIEGLVDCCSFVVVPAAFVVSVCQRRELTPAIVV